MMSLLFASSLLASGLCKPQQESFSLSINLGSDDFQPPVQFPAPNLPPTNRFSQQAASFPGRQSASFPSQQAASFPSQQAASFPSQQAASSHTQLSSSFTGHPVTSFRNQEAASFLAQQATSFPGQPVTSSRNQEAASFPAAPQFPATPSPFPARSAPAPPLSKFPSSPSDNSGRFFPAATEAMRPFTVSTDSLSETLTRQTPEEFQAALDRNAEFRKQWELALENQNRITAEQVEKIKNIQKLENSSRVAENRPVVPITTAAPRASEGATEQVTTPAKTTTSTPRVNTEKEAEDIVAEATEDLSEIESEEVRLLREHRKLLETLDSALADVVELAHEVLPPKLL